MKEKMKPMLIGGGIGAAAGAGAAFLMGKKDTKNLVLFGGIGLAVGAVVCYLMCKDKSEEEKSNASGGYSKKIKDSILNNNETSSKKTWYTTKGKVGQNEGNPKYGYYK